MVCVVRNFVFFLCSDDSLGRLSTTRIHRRLVLRRRSLDLGLRPFRLYDYVLRQQERPYNLAWNRLLLNRLRYTHIWVPDMGYSFVIRYPNQMQRV